ncbi:fimbrial protein [Enterobacter asburiae]|uniref:fimbrial protein n=1 Tax=Enterobacter asburiae TaxID=61645 RepID=UPI002FFB0141
MMKQDMQQPKMLSARKMKYVVCFSRLAGMVTAVGITTGVMSLPQAHAAAAPDKVLTLNETVTAVTCDVSVPATLALDNMNVGSVTGTSPDKSTGKTFNVTLNCQGGAAPGGSTVGVWGTPDNTGSVTTLFKNLDTSAGAAKGVGFVLTNSQDGLGGFLRAAGTQANATRVVAGKQGDNLDKKTIPFFIMPYRGGYGVSAVKAGTLRTTLNFDFQWD